MTDVRPFPEWRYALQVILERGIDYGSIIKKSELIELFGLKQPKTAEEQEKFQLDFMRYFSDFRDELLEEHRLALRTMWGDGSYQVIHPADQTEAAVNEGAKEMRRALRKMTKTLVFVRHEELTAEQQKQNADAQAKAAMLAGMVRQKQIT